MEKLTLEDTRIYSVPQLSRVLQIRTKTLYAMAKQGKIPYFRLSESNRIKFAGWQIRKWLDDQVTSNEGGTAI